MQNFHSNQNKGPPVPNSRRFGSTKLTYVVIIAKYNSGFRHVSLSTNGGNFSYNFSFIPSTLKRDSAIEIASYTQDLVVPTAFYFMGI